MSALTKTFVVLLVVMSLLVSGAVVVFANRSEDYKTQLTAATSSANKATAALAVSKADAAAQRAQADQARLARDQAVTAGEVKAAALEQTIARLNGQIADMTSNAAIMTVTLDHMTGVVNASEAARKLSGEQLATTRADLDKAVGRISELNLALSDYTSKLEAAQRTVTSLTETNAQLKLDYDKVYAWAKDHGYDPNTDNGIQTATINVGSSQDVKPGMVFHIINRQGGQFVGELTVEKVDSQNATGKIEGPHLNAIVPNVTEVRTQL